MKFCKSILCFILVVMLFSSTVFFNDGGTNVAVSAATSLTVDKVSYWTGGEATDFAGGDGTKESPYIIATAEQLYKMVKSDGLLSDGTQGYFKVADGVEAFYLNDITFDDTLNGIQTLVSVNNYQNWTTTQNFNGNFDGNGVYVRGMVSYKANGFVYGLVGGAVIKNVNFDSCYVYSTGNAAIVTTRLGSYSNETDTSIISNISVRNSYIQTTRNISLGTSGAHGASAGGIVSSSDTPKQLTISNCLFDGYSSQLIQGNNSTVDATAGIFANSNYVNNYTIESCVSLGAQVVPQVVGVNYTRYDENNNSGYQVKFYNSYCDLEEVSKETPVVKIDTKTQYELNDMPGLNWLYNWQLATVSGGEDKFDGAVRVIPMVKSNADCDENLSNFSAQIAAQNNGGGAYSVFGGAYFSGTYGMYHALVGSGTEEDPYMIYNAFELARAIASGGMNVYNRVYYKLACDIDASGSTWITQDAIGTEGSEKYKYVEFGGQLDGDGHVVSGVSVGDDQSVGLIPILSATGVVKNLHIRNSCFVSGSEYAGAIAGDTQIGAQIIGCSVENSVVASQKADNHIVGRIKGTVLKNSYYIAGENSSAAIETRYYKENGSIGTIDVSGNNDQWYRGGKDGSTPRLKNFAVAQALTDVDGDGVVTEYTARDLAALRQKLLLDKNYQYIYADVDRNGETNILDLVVLCNEMIGDFSNPNNEFWRNVKLGRVNIYYGENDSYDAARKLELYLEAAVPDVDIKKVVSADKTVSGTSSDASAVYVHSNDLVGKPTGELEIIVGDIANYSDYAKNTLDVNDYAITYDAEKGVLWFKGGSFTGVEQAILDFISNSKVETGDIYTVERATLSEEKQAKTVLVDTDYDGEADTEKVLYYAWGDEFDGITNSDEDENSQISIDTWNHSRMRTETESGKAGNYNNVETANETELSKLYSIENGRLTITRGIKTEYATDDTDKLGYVRLENQTGYTALKDQIDDEDIIANPGLIKTNSSMLYKQGYAEMYGSLPSDGHTFASWWMLGHGSYNNYAIDETLFSKIYKLNNTGEYAYDGTSTWPLSTDPKTYKYQIPTNYFEIDVWELMQNPSLTNSTLRKTKTTGSYDYRLYLNVHKFYSVGARSADVVNVIDWDNPSTPRAVMNKEYFGSKSYYFSTSAAYYDFTDGTTTRLTKDWLGRITANYAEELQKQLTAPRRYGFYWSTNGVDKFNFTLYIYDINGDGVEDDNAILGTSDMTYNKDSGMDPQDYDCVNDAEVANQYMYFLFDNVLYTSNPYHNNSTDEEAVMHTDMLVNNGTTANPDKIALDIDYIRVYQFDGKRDIIVRETEDFNNGNHFGY